MNMFRTLASATAIAAVASTSFAGGLSDQIMEAPAVVETEVAPAGSSVDPALIVLGILGLLIFVGSSDSDDEPERCTERVCLVQELEIQETR